VDAASGAAADGVRDTTASSGSVTNEVDTLRVDLELATDRSIAERLLEEVVRATSDVSAFNARQAMVTPVGVSESGSFHSGEI